MAYGSGSRVALGIAYDGAPWQGWQTQPHGRTVQDTLETALLRFVGQPVSTTCAGRTDTGVHALCQVVHLDAPVHRSLQSWVRGVNAWLPDSISVQWARYVDDDFHARFSAMSRTYVYVLRHHPVRSPLAHARVGWVFQPLSLDRMQAAADLAVGEHDFSSFRSSECQSRSPVRVVHGIDVQQQGDYFLFHFHANAYLHHMIRNLMGVLIAVGQGRREPGWMAELLARRDRRLSAPTFSPDGLYLAQVSYDARYDIPALPAETLLASLSGIAFTG